MVAKSAFTKTDRMITLYAGNSAKTISRELHTEGFKRNSHAKYNGKKEVCPPPLAVPTIFNLWHKTPQLYVHKREKRRFPYVTVGQADLNWVWIVH
jgi:hypothetical protein